MTSIRKKRERKQSSPKPTLKTATSVCPLARPCLCHMWSPQTKTSFAETLRDIVERVSAGEVSKEAQSAIEEIKSSLKACAAHQLTRMSVRKYLAKNKNTQAVIEQVTSWILSEMLTIHAKTTVDVPHRNEICAVWNISWGR